MLEKVCRYPKLVTLRHSPLGGGVGMVKQSFNYTVKQSFNVSRLANFTIGSLAAVTCAKLPTSTPKNKKIKMIGIFNKKIKKSEIMGISN
jgi:hypothetical protein